MGRVRDTLEVSLLTIADRYAELTQSSTEVSEDEAARLERELEEYRRRATLIQPQVVIGARK